jgi:hypothetical protein
MDRDVYALVGKLIHLGGLLGVFNGQANNAPVSVQVKVDVFVEFARFHRRTGGEFYQCRISVGKVFNMHRSLLQITLEEGVVHSLAIFKQDDAQRAVVHFRDEHPAPYSPLGLSLFSPGLLDGPHNPLILDDGSIWARSRIQEKMGCFHDRACSFCRNERVSSENLYNQASQEISPAQKPRSRASNHTGYGKSLQANNLIIFSHKLTASV